VSGAASDPSAPHRKRVDAVVLAGGRISGPYALAAGTTVKAAAVLGGRSIAQRAVDALQGAPGIARVCVVGPEVVRDALEDPGLWLPETETALGNLMAGIEHLGPAPEERILACGSDLPFIDTPSVQDFLDRAPAEADACLPMVFRDVYLARFPASHNIYVPLVDGPVTGGSQYLLRPGIVFRNLALLERLFQARKSQVRMAGILGVGLIFRLLTRRLTVAALEARGSALTGFVCRAVRDCRPELAYDIDGLPEFEYAKRVLEERETGAGTVQRGA
jgi:molybdopterin-guanine dinucleotide biosynthesis protein A